MQFKLDYDPYDKWTKTFKAYKEGRVRASDFEVARHGAQMAAGVLFNFFESADTRRKKLKRTQEDVRSIINEIAKNSKRTAHAEWLRGYLEYNLQNYTKARQHFQQIESVFETNADFLADLGRFEYNTGRILAARATFEKLFPLRDQLIQQPLQAYRWLAKSCRHSQDFDRELKVLLQLHDETIGKLNRGAELTEDFEESLLFVSRHLGEAYLNNAKPKDAFHWVDRTIKPEMKGIAVIQARQGTRALLAMGKEKEAGEWAEKWAVRLKHPDILNDYIASSKLQFSAFQKKQQVLANLGAENREEQSTWLLYSDGGQRVETSTGELSTLYYEIQRCFNFGYVEEAVEAIYALAEKVFTSSETPVLLAQCMAMVNSNSAVIPKTKKLAAVFTEARERFPEEAAIRSQYGQFLLKAGDLESAMAELKAAWEILGEQEALFPVLFGKVCAAMANHEQAKIHFESAIAKCKGEDLVIAYRDAIDWAVSCGRYLDALHWSYLYLDSFLGETNFPEQELGAIGFPKNKHVRQLLKLSGQAALALGEYHRAVFYFDALLANYGRFLTLLVPRSESAFSYQGIGEASLLLAQAHILSDNISAAKDLVVQAETVDPVNLLIPAVKAMLAAAEGNLAEAVALLLKNQLEDWLLAAAGAFVLAKGGTETERVAELSELRARVAAARGELPSSADLMKQCESQNAKVSEMEERVRDLEQTYASLRQSVKRIVDQIPMPANVAEAKKDILKAIDTGKTSDEAIDNFVSKLVREYGKGKEVAGYVDRIPAERWPKLDQRIKERIIAADQYVSAVLSNTIDLGPAVLALSSALEIQVKETIIKPFINDLRNHDRELEYKANVNMRNATLGTASYIFGLKDPEFSAFVTQWVTKKFPGQKYYILNDLPGKIDKVASLRNSWAHGGPGVNLDSFKKLESLLLDKDEGLFVRLITA